MNNKELIKKLGFFPKENAVGIYEKRFQQHVGYAIEIDFDKKVINYGNLISIASRTTTNFSQEENFVVLECVNRLLEKGYKPQNIILEKTWPSGHGTSARLDICVTRDDGTEYLLIECKTFGKEFEKELNNMNKNGGQLFTYFKFSNKADIIMLYASELNQDKIIYKNEIVKIEDEYRSGDVKDFYEKWNKLTKDNGVFDTWVTPYSFESKALTKSQLKPITQADSSFIFNRFLEILRHNVVSDKGNAFNKIFTLFLCKVYDETSSKDNDELKFQWVEGQDDDVSFQLRLTDLYKNGMLRFLSRTVSDFDEAKFENEYKHLSEETKKQILKEIHKLRLEKNNEFAIKEVYDYLSFLENAKIVKEVVELLQGYRIRYNKRQQYLSDFFELLLTTGLKQESGQFFTPVPIAQFIIKSLPLDKLVNEKLNQKDGDLLPYMIDYAAGSGHFITEYMHEVQNIINQKDENDFIDLTSKKIKNWKEDHFDWANDYVYGIEKDYRLVKVGKVGCYLHGDGLANVILSDGLASFVKNKDYKGKLKKESDGTKDNQQFDLILSNPPYSIESFKQTTRDCYTEEDFELYQRLTENSSEIECLFIERTKQLLKDGGIAGIILPSSILSNAGIYTKAREMILEYFDIVATTEFGSNTFMATGTNTVVLFLKRRNNFDCINIKKSVQSFFDAFKDITINSIENPVNKFVSHAWKNIAFDDYISLLNNKPNENIQKNDLYKDYEKKIKAKDKKDFFNKLIEIEKEKLYYFILVSNQKTVLVKTGEKDAEKRFLGYEFSNRRGSEGIHPTQRSKSVDECTSLFDGKTFDNPKKASTYIYQAFNGDFKSEIDESLNENVSRVNLVDLLTFDRVDFEKSISLNAKKKLKIESKWSLEKLENITINLDAKRIPLTKSSREKGKYPYYGATGIIDYVKDYIFAESLVLIGEDGAKWGAGENSAFIASGKYWVNNHAHVLSVNDFKIKDKYLVEILNYLDLSNYITGLNVPKLNQANLNNIKIPLPPIDIQEKIVAEIEKVEEAEYITKEKLVFCEEQLKALIKTATGKKTKLEKVISLNYGESLPKYLREEGSYPVVGANGIDGYHNAYSIEGPSIIVGRKGSVGKVNLITQNCTPIDTCYYLTIDESQILFKYAFYLLKSLNLESLNKGSGPGGLNRNDAYSIDLIIPSIQDQQKIVAEIEKLETQIVEAQKIIDNSAARKQVIFDKYLK